MYKSSPKKTPTNDKNKQNIVTGSIFSILNKCENIAVKIGIDGESIPMVEASEFSIINGNSDCRIAPEKQPASIVLLTFLSSVKTIIGLFWLSFSPYVKKIRNGILITDLRNRNEEPVPPSTMNSFTITEFATEYYQSNSLPEYRNIDNTINKFAKTTGWQFLEIHENVEFSEDSGPLLPQTSQNSFEQRCSHVHGINGISELVFGSSTFKSQSAMIPPA